MFKIEHTGTIEVRDEEGATHFIDVFTRFNRYVGDRGEQWLPGSKEYELDGEHCNVEGDAFRTLETRRLLKRV